MLLVGGYGSIYQKISYIVSQKRYDDDEFLEKLAKVAIVARVFRLEGLYYLVRPLLVQSSERLPNHLKVVVGDVGCSCGLGREDFLWYFLGKKMFGRRIGVIDRVRYMMVKSSEVDWKSSFLISLIEERLGTVQVSDVERLIGL